MRVFARLAAVLCGLAAASVHAQSSAAAGSLGDSKFEASDLLQAVQVTAAGDPENRVGAPVFVTIDIKNVSPRPVVVENLTIEVDALASSRFESSSPCVLDRIGEIRLGIGESYRQACRFPISEGGQRSNAASDRQSLSTGWNAQKWYQYLLAADLRLAVEIGVMSSGTQRAFPTVQIKAAEYSVFVGGVFGAMLLALFVLVERLLKQPDVREKWGRNLLLTILLGLRGGVMATIALLLGQTTQGGSAPVSLTVVDFSGGILIGLFSYPLASWISSTLKLDSVPAAPVRVPVSDAPSQVAAPPIPPP